MLYVCDVNIGHEHAGTFMTAVGVTCPDLPGISLTSLLPNTIDPTGQQQVWKNSVLINERLSVLVNYVDYSIKWIYGSFISLGIE